jgi:ABC-2 type transport system permease protein
MMRQLRMTWFQIRQYISVPYFIQMMAFSTAGVTLLQVLAYHAWGGDPRTMWMRAGIIGVWTTSTSAAGILGFERYKGTLVHLVSARINPLRALAAVVSAAATFGLAAIPLAWAIWSLATWSTGGLGVMSVGGLLRGMFGIILLWVSCLSITFVVAALFVLTPNAIAYEELLLQPVLVLSGILFTQQRPPAIVEWFEYLIPLAFPARVLLTGVHGTALVFDVVWALGVCAIWFAAAGFAGRSVLVRVRKTATLEVI